MNRSRKILGILAVILLLTLVITNSVLFKLYIDEIKESEEEINFFSNWFCIGGVYNTMYYYNIHNNISIDREVYDFLSIEICYQSIYENASIVEIDNLIKQGISEKSFNQSNISS